MLRSFYLFSGLELNKNKCYYIIMFNWNINYLGLRKLLYSVLLYDQIPDSYKVGSYTVINYATKTNCYS